MEKDWGGEVVTDDMRVDVKGQLWVLIVFLCKRVGDMLVLFKHSGINNRDVDLCPYLSTCIVEIPKVWYKLSV